jgi:hypothetical protein
MKRQSAETTSNLACHSFGNALDAQVEAGSVGGEHPVAQMKPGKFTVGKPFANVVQPSRVAAAQVENCTRRSAVGEVLDLWD